MRSIPARCGPDGRKSVNGFEIMNMDHADIVLSIMNSNPDYNRMVNGSAHRSLEEAVEEIGYPGQQGWMLRDGARYVGLLFFLEENPKDGFPWLGLLMIDGNEQGKGYGRSAYRLFEAHLLQLNKLAVRIGIVRENAGAKAFWTGLGFEYVESKMSGIGKEVDCCEKKLAR